MAQQHPKPQHVLRLMNCLECKEATYVQDSFPRLCGVCTLNMKAERDRLLEQHNLLQRRQSNKYVEKLELDVAQLTGAVNKLVKRLRDQGDVVPLVTIAEVEKAITVARTTCGFPASHPHGCICLVNQSSAIS